jgi:hypothetical protein
MLENTSSRLLRSIQVQLSPVWYLKLKSWTPVARWPRLCCDRPGCSCATASRLLVVVQGTVTNETRCLCCETLTSRDETFFDLSLDIEQNSSITSCLRNFSSTETLNAENKFFCDKCCSLQVRMYWQEPQERAPFFSLRITNPQGRWVIIWKVRASASRIQPRDTLLWADTRCRK